MKKIVITLFLTCTISISYASDLCTIHPDECPVSSQTIEGSTTTQTILNQVISTTPQTTEAQAGKSTGVTATITSNVKVISLPLSYSINKTYEINLSIPYVSKKMKGEYNTTAEELSQSGIGDISIGGTHYLKLPKYYIVSNFTVKTPTGNQRSFENEKERLPLGSGSFDFIASSSASMKIAKIEGLKITGGLTLRLNGTGEYTETYTFASVRSDYTFKRKAGNSYSLFTGGIYQLPLPKLFIYGNLKYLHISKTENSFTSPADINYEQKNDDALTALDLTIGSRYLIKKDLTARLGFALPISTSYKTGDGSSRDLVIDLGVDYFW